MFHIPEHCTLAAQGESLSRSSSKNTQLLGVLWGDVLRRCQKSWTVLPPQHAKKSRQVKTKEIWSIFHQKDPKRTESANHILSKQGLMCTPSCRATALCLLHFNIVNSACWGTCCALLTSTIWDGKWIDCSWKILIGIKWASQLLLSK